MMPSAYGKIFMMAISKSKAFNEALHSIGIVEPIDVLKHLPRKYDDFTYSLPKSSYEDKERVVLLGKIVGNMPKCFRFAKRSVYRFSFETTNDYVFEVEAWNQTYLSHYLNLNDVFTLVGYFDKKRNKITLSKILKGEIERNVSLRPIYSLPSNIANHTYQALVKRTLLSYQGKLEDEVPSSLMKKYRLSSAWDSFKDVHFPNSKDEIHQGMRYFKYQEALSFSLRNQLVRGENKALAKDIRRKIPKNMMERFINSLPYSPTNDQMKAFQECLADMNSSQVMYRLLQGDVGTGKTLVAALCAYANHLRSEQTAIMAPTDSLARQHYDNLKKIFEGTNMNIALLVGSLSLSEKRAIADDLKDGTIDLVVGTHALFSSKVEYAYLGLVIIDEQHKFGVNQRTLLVDKGEHADLLMMSATPIPRTLTLTVYGDLDVSTLSEFPAKKRDVKSQILSPNDPKIQTIIQNAISSKHRVYIVVPQIEGGEKENTSVLEIAEEYKKLYPNKVTMMHGKMSEEDKEVAQIAFRTGLCPILVATSLIEVGIDVKEANTMVVYAPTHFSLSSLHQLRGRIGRDGTPSLFVMAYKKGEEPDGEEKLNILLKTDDGFKIAEEDLRLRGPGEILGVKQSGLPSFNALNVIDDFKIFECARNDATWILMHKNDPENKEIIERIQNEKRTSLS